MTNFTNADKLAELQREIEMRRNVYPKQVNAGRMDLSTASRRMSIIRAIAADYQDMVDAEAPPAA